MTCGKGNIMNRIFYDAVEENPIIAATLISGSVLVEYNDLNYAIITTDNIHEIENPHIGLCAGVRR